MTRLLIVEDSPTQAEALRLALEDAGFEVEVARSGEAALVLLAQGTFETIVSDVVMPGMSGYDLCRKVKSRAGGAELPVLLLTTLRDPMDIIQGLECGADGFLVKPCDTDRLIERVRSLLASRRMRLEGKLKVGAEVLFMGRRLSIASDKEQILGLLISSFEETIRTNRELQARERELAVAKHRLDEYARGLEGQLRISSERYRMLMEQATDAILVLGAEGRILESNLQAEQLLGPRPGGLAGHSFAQFVAGSEDDKARAQTAWGEANVRLADLPLQAEGGRVFAADISATTLEVGSAPTTLVIVRDVSDRNRRERQLRENEKLALMGTLAAGVAHEINNPLAFVQSNLHFIKEFAETVQELRGALEQIAAEAPAETREAIEAALEHHAVRERTEEFVAVNEESLVGVQQMAQIVRDMKSLARTDSEEKQPVDVNAVLEWSIRMVGAQLKHHATLKLELERELPVIAGIPGRLGQVFTNLLVNASQAFTSGDSSQNVIRIATRVEGARLAVDIEDNGRGIPPEHHDRLFEPFFTTKPPGVGTGLGLPICQDIVRSHGGEIEVCSTVGEGTRFRVILPIS